MSEAMAHRVPRHTAHDLPKVLDALCRLLSTAGGVGVSLSVCPLISLYLLITQQTFKGFLEQPEIGSSIDPTVGYIQNRQYSILPAEYDIADVGKD